MASRIGKKMSESAIKKDILTFLNFRRDCFAFPVATVGVPDGKGGFRTNKKQKGCPDIILCCEGFFIGIEVKTEASFMKFFKNPGEHEKTQREFHTMIRTKGCGEVWVVASVDQVMQQLKKFRENCL